MNSAAEAQKTFDQATNLLGEAKFKEARELLLELTKNGYTSTAVEINLGRASVESGELGLGIFHYTNAVALSRFDSAAREDLFFAQSKVDGGVGVSMKHPAEWGNAISSYLRPSECLFFASTFLVGLLLLKLYVPIKRATYIGGGLLVAMFLTFATFGKLGQSLAVLKSDADLRTAPLVSAEVVAPLKSGTRLRVIRKSGDFTEVERTGSFRGWMDSSALVTTPF